MHITTDDSLIDDLRASVNARHGVGAGQTFGDFIAACRLMGVKDTDTLGSIEYGVSQFGNGWVTRDDDVDGVSIKERS